MTIKSIAIAIAAGLLLAGVVRTLLAFIIVLISKLLDKLFD